MNQGFQKKSFPGAELGSELIPHLIVIFNALGYTDLSLRLTALQERLFEGRFFLAVLGQFKRGKSSLINALLGEELLPTSVVPLTAVPTFIRTGTGRKAKIIFKGDKPAQEFLGTDSDSMREYLAKYVSEELNPSNRLGVEQVEIEHPAQILKSGLVLIDTPGIGSTFEHNTEATLNFLPQCDAGLFVVSADPPITNVEVDFLKEVYSKVNCLFFVFNKIDYLNQKDREKSLTFFREVLQEKAGDQGAPIIFPVSSLLSLRAKLDGSVSELEKTGLKQLEDYLVKFLAQEKETALLEAIRKKVYSLSQEALMRLNLTIKSLKMPAEQLEQKRALLEEKLKSVQEQKQVQKDLIEGDRKRVLENLEELVQELRNRAIPKLQMVINQTRAEKGIFDEKFLQTKLEQIIPTLFEHEYGVLFRSLEERVKKVLNKHQQRGEQLIEEVRKIAIEIFEIPFSSWETLESFELEKNPHWVTHQWNCSFGVPPLDWIELLLPRRIRDSKIQRKIEEQIDDLVCRNAENIRWSSLQIIQDSFRKFSEFLDQRFAEIISSISEALNFAYLKRREQAEAVAEQIRIFEKSEKQLSRVIEKL